MLIFGLFMFFIGLFGILKPHLVWIFSEKWKGNADEPSDIYLFITRIIGFVICFYSLFAIIYTI